MALVYCGKGAVLDFGNSSEREKEERVGNIIECRELNKWVIISIVERTRKPS